MNLLTKTELDRLLQMDINKSLHTVAVKYVQLRARRGGQNEDDMWRSLTRLPCCFARLPSTVHVAERHGASAIHLAHLHGINERVGEVRRLARTIKKYPILENWDVMLAAKAGHAALVALAEI